jgi:hypothetical protein
MDALGIPYGFSGGVAFGRAVVEVYIVE